MTAATNCELLKTTHWDSGRVWGWTAKQYMVAWTYFTSHEVVLDKRLTIEEQSDSFLASLADLQAAWLSEFEHEPCTGPMQVYDPEISPVHEQVVKQLFGRLRLRYE